MISHTFTAGQELPFVHALGTRVPIYQCYDASTGLPVIAGVSPTATTWTTTTAYLYSAAIITMNCAFINAGDVPGSVGICSGFLNSMTVTLHPPTGATVGQTNFPVRLNGTYGGHLNAAGGMQNANGWDQCDADTTNTTIYPIQIQLYDSTNGVYETVTAPAIPANPGTVQFKHYWGKAGVSVDPSSTTVWDANYKQVFTLQANGFPYIDQTSNVTNLTTGTASTRVVGPLPPGFAQTFTAASSMFLRGNSALTVGSTNRTISAFFKSAAAGSTQVIADVRDVTAAGIAFYLTPAGFAECDDSGTVPNAAVDSTNHADGNWHYFSCTVDGATGVVTSYVDGVLAATITHTPLPFPSSATITVGAATAAFGAYFNGQIGEVRASESHRSASWIANDAYNHLNPTSFITVSIP